jgi:hypothetical protein
VRRRGNEKSGLSPIIRLQLLSTIRMYPIGGHMVNWSVGIFVPAIALDDSYVSNQRSHGELDCRPRLWRGRRCSHPPLVGLTK